MKPGTKVKMTDELKNALIGLGCADHVNEFGTCVGVVDGPSMAYGGKGPEVDVRWQPSNLRYAYNPDDLEVVEMLSERWLEKVVSGCLKDTIRAHGDITKDWIGSAAKRISHQVFGEFKAASVNGDGHEGCAAKVAELEGEIKRLQRKNASLKKSSDYWRLKCGGTEQDEIERLKSE